MNWQKRGMAIALSGLLCAAANAQQVTRFVTGSAPGGGVDYVARTVGEAIGPLLGRTVIVENKPGASYNIAAEAVAKAPPDGNTVLVTFNVHPIAGALHPTLPFDPVKDFRAIGMVATTPYALVANPKVPGNTLKEMIELAKAQGRPLSFASIGLGTPQHLMLERLKQQTGVDIMMVHYKTPSTGQTDVAAGHVDFILSTIAFCEPLVKAGKLKVLAVTSDQRLPQFPDAPTARESGYEGFITDGWYGLLAPAGTPDGTVQAYNDALAKVLAMPDIQAKFQSAGLKPMPGKPEELDRQIREDAAMWQKVITEQDIKAE
ncbi:tripartite tricarboxylate transporter substrate binding protein [Verticiella sediminum]|uniref:Tripartite tricarboxylate transporter substrate binding protein n=1 Tax=Verticiella sediminum TaxID=1247510 RepID=A0A556B2Z2_9BURK|nr:tripartite tricarboxylate transporter substrate binding protein [Verticiella sediminum]TSH99205.1 tripartite tricarboxylate transporter substrate binding protein [Verticiella sediminum]